MLALIIIAAAILIFSFFYGAIKLWKKKKPLYFQIIIAAIGCYALYQLFTVVMVFCDINEIYFNDGFFGLFGSYLFLLCANTGVFEKIFEKPKTQYLVISILSGVLLFGISLAVSLLYFGGLSFNFFIFILQQLPACFVVYFNVKHLFTPVDDLGLIKDIRLTDIFSILFCVMSLLDILAWTIPGIISGIADLVLSLVALGLTLTCVKGGQKWRR